jgi:DNA-binding NtrC family response regulator
METTVSTMKSSPILIVDDEIGVRESLKIVFSKDHPIFEAETLEAAVAKVREAKPAVVLLDVLLPRSDGIEVLKQIKAIHPDCEVIMLTALNTRLLADKAMELGAFDLIGKPFDVIELRGKVRGALAKVSRKTGHRGPAA